jgi:hypothetical protein
MSLYGTAWLWTLHTQPIRATSTDTGAALDSRVLSFNSMQPQTTARTRANPVVSSPSSSKALQAKICFPENQTQGPLNHRGLIKIYMLEAGY